MFIINSKIQIGNFELNFCVEINIKSSFETLTDTAKIILPRKLAWQDKSIASDKNPLFKVGDKVKIEIGYDQDLEQVYSGYITKIFPKTPCEIECEDDMYILKKRTIEKKSYLSVTLKQLLTDILSPDKIPFFCPDVVLGKFRISRATPAMILDEIKKTYALNSWFKNGTLYVGSAVARTDENERKKLNFNFRKNITDEGNLNFQKSEDVKIKVKAISMLPNNSKIEIDEGDADGENGTRTLHFYNLNETELRKRAKTEYEKFKYTGFSGNFTALGYPRARHGDIAVLNDDEVKDRNGEYLIKAVEYNLSVSGGWRQKIEIDRLISQKK